MQRICFIFCLFLLSRLVSADELPRVDPERAGFSAERIQRVHDVVRSYVDDGRVTGVVTLVSRDGAIVHESAYGTMGLDNDKAMAQDSLFRILSMTKAVTAVAALVLYEEGHFQLYDPVSKYLPAFSDMMIYSDGELVPAERDITIHHLFTHMSGLSYGYPEDHPVNELVEAENPYGAASLIEFAERVAALPLLFEPGTDWEYSYSTDVLGAVVEKISGQSLGDFFRDRIFKPLDMKDTGYVVPAGKLERLATSHTWNPEAGRMEITSGVPFEAPYRQVPVDSGGAGLISTARDYLRFLEMLRQGGSLDGVRILGPKTVRFMTMDHLPQQLTQNNVWPNADLMLGLGGSHALGVGIYADPVRRGVLSSPGELEWGGAAGTLYWWDPVEDIVVVSMIQLFRSPWQLRLRDDLSVAIYQALTDVRQGPEARVLLR